MKKKWLLITIIIAALTIGGIASAQVTAPNLWKIVSGSIRPVVSSWELGSATSRIQKGWFTNLDASNATIGSIAVSGTVSGDMVVGGQIRATNGTSTAPSYSFNSDTNTGLMWTGNDAFKFVNGGNDTLAISSAGQVKINNLASSSATLIMADTLGNLYSSADNRITSASSPLVLAANSLSITKASSTASGYLSNTDWSTFNGKVSSQWTTSGSNIYYTTGSVGIGTAAPRTRLDFASSTGDVIHVSGGQVAGLNSVPTRNDHAVPLGYLNNNFMPIGVGVKGSGTGGYHAKWSGTTSTSTLMDSIIYDNGTNVGIGKTNPAANLEVYSSLAPAPTIFRINNRNIHYLEFGGAYPTGMLVGGYENHIRSFNADNFIIYTSNSVPLHLGTNSTSRLTITGAGNVGLGTTNPAGKLHLSTISPDRTSVVDSLFLENMSTGGAPYQGHGQGIAFYGRTYPSSTQKVLSRIYSVANDHSASTAGTDLVFQNMTDNADSSPSTKMIIKYNGNVGIGTTAPGEKLEVNGNIKATGYKSSDGTIGTSTTINVRKADDSGACTITVKNGLVTATTCP